MQKSLAKATFVGVLVTAVQTIGGRFAGLASQLAVAYYLTPEHLSTVALSLTLVSVTGVLQASGLAEVMVNRQKAFHAWSVHGHALALKLGLIAAICTISIAPLLAICYGDTQIFWLCLIYAIGQIIHSHGVVPTAQLQAELKFVSLAKFNLCSTLTLGFSLVVSAVMGLGAFSFGISRLAQTCVMTVLARRKCPLKTSRQPRKARQVSLLSEASVLLLISLTSTVSLQADYFALRMFHTAEMVGVYFFAFTIAGKTAQLIGGSVTSVIHPVLAKASGSVDRQSRITLRLISLVACVGYPLTVLQASSMPLLFNLVLPEKWIQAMPIAQVMSVGLGFNMVCGIGWGLLKVQRKPLQLLKLNGSFTSAFVVLTLVVSYLASPLALAFFVAIYCLVYTATLSAVVWRSLGMSLLPGVLSTLRPALISVTVALAMHYQFGFGTQSSLHQIPEFALACCCYILVTYAITWLLDPLFSDECRPLFRRLIAVR
ncbi:MAG: oligosaccharide flippase family protein [Planctomycetota bacterium]